VAKVEEKVFFDAVKTCMENRVSESTIKQIVLDGFILRPWMMDVVHTLKAHGLIVGILSDQTNWLDELNDRDNFFPLFDYVFNSFHTGVTKKEPASFMNALSAMGKKPHEVIMVDDHLPNIERAAALGINVIHYRGEKEFIDEMAEFFPFFRK
jgi:HAD superfamily hydrolase (TIGR01509 family)